MAADRPYQVFLNWTPTKKTEVARKEDLYRRHQHAARINHQKRKDYSKLAKQASKVELPQFRAMLPKADAQKENRADISACMVRGAWLEPPLSPACIDPFDVFCVKDLSGQAQHALKFFMTHSWPMYANSSRTQDVDQWISATMKNALECRPLLNCLIYGASSFQCYFGGRQPSAELLRLQSFHGTLRTLQEELATTDRDISEVILLTIAVLALYGSLSSPRKRVISTEPRAVRENYFYSSIEWEPVHINALLSLTVRQGGLSRLKSFSVASIIFLIDTQYAATMLQRPVLSFSFATKPSLQKLYGHLDCATREKLDNLESYCLGFAFLKTCKEGEALLQLVFETWSMLECYDYYVRNPNCGIDLYDIIGVRRLLQHAAISSEPATDTLHVLSRRAIIAFISDCLSPLYPGSAFHHNNAEAIKTAVLECIESKHFQVPSEFMVWILVLGGYIARETPFRSWYRDQLQNGPILPSTADWDFVQRVSEQYLPFRFEPGRHCLEFWNEACVFSSHG